MLAGRRRPGMRNQLLQFPGATKIGMRATGVKMHPGAEVG